MSSKYIKKYTIPPGFQDLLSEFTKEILRNQPEDIIDFGVEYFKCLQQGLILDYAYKGVNIPCDFKPSIPKIPSSLKNLRNSIIETVSQIQKEHSKKNIPKNIEQENVKEEFPFIQKEEGCFIDFFTNITDKDPFNFVTETPKNLTPSELQQNIPGGIHYPNDNMVKSSLKKK